VENVPNATEGMIGIYSKDGNFTNEGNITIKNTNTLGFGILASNSNVTNKGNISLEDSLMDYVMTLSRHSSYSRTTRFSRVSRGSRVSRDKRSSFKCIPPKGMEVSGN